MKFIYERQTGETIERFIIEDEEQSIISNFEEPFSISRIIQAMVFRIDGKELPE